MLTRKQASTLTRRLDKIANHIQANYPQIGLSQKEAYDFCLYLDKTSDQIESVTATTLLRDQDEPYMDTFNSPKGPIEIEPDEPYMNHFEDDTDSQVVEDDDLAPLSDGDWEVEAGFNWYAEEDEDEEKESSFNWYAEEDEDEDEKEASFNWYAEDHDEEDEEKESSFNWYAEEDEDEDEEKEAGYHWYSPRSASRRRRR